MSLTIYPSHAYAFLGGMFIGKFTNLFSDVVITGLVLYIVTPEIFTEDRVHQVKNYVYGLFDRFKPQPQSQNRIQNKLTGKTIQLSTLPKIEIMPSPHNKE